MKKEYVLRRVDEQEIERLGFQHEVWKAQTEFAIEKSLVKAGETIMDLGCGAGYLSFDLAKLVGTEGKIFALDNSDKFISFIEQQNIKNIQAIKTDIRKAFSQIENLDACHKIFCRWVLMFTGELEKVFENAYDALLAGGQFVSIEYFNFEQIGLFPQSDAFDLIYNNVQKILKQNGGDSNVGNRVYQVMEATGFKNIKTYPIYRTGKPGSDLWQWLERTSQNHTNLVDANLISSAELQQYVKDWQTRSKSQHSFVTAPPLMITIGEK